MMMWRYIYIFAAEITEWPKLATKSKQLIPTEEKKIRIFVSLIGYYFMFVWRKLQNISNFTMSKNASFSLFLTTQIFHVINAFSVLANAQNWRQNDKEKKKKNRTHKWKRRINKSERTHKVPSETAVGFCNISKY